MNADIRSQSHLPLYYPFLPPSAPQTLSHSLLFMELFHHVFLHAYYRGLPYASGMAPMKHLNNLSPPVCLATLSKVFPQQSRKIIHVICIFGEGRGEHGPKRNISRFYKPPRQDSPQPCGSVARFLLIPVLFFFEPFKVMIG